jgi:glutamyl-tRNA synthetase
VSALTVASTTRRDFILQDARATLDARHEMFGGRLHQTDGDGSTTPDAFGPIAFEDHRHSGSTVEAHPPISAESVDERENEGVIGRFAPSPTGPLHVGNLRTALIAWLHARSGGGEMVVRIEDLDRANSSRQNEERQLAALAALGLDHEPVTVRQSERFDHYRDVIADLRRRDLVYECYCTRREIREAVNAPHEHEVRYPGTCRELTARQRSERIDSGRPPALRLRTDTVAYVVDDVIAGATTSPVDDFVLQRNDGVPAYNLAVVVDDAHQRVDEVVRGDDLLASTGRQMHLQHLLGFSTPLYAHVPLVLGPDGERLAKRHGAVTLDDLAERGIDAVAVLRVLARSIGLDADTAITAADLVDEFRTSLVPKVGWIIPVDWQTERHVR